MKALANLHESLEWLNLRLRKTFAKLNADVDTEGDVLMNLNNILSKFQSVSEQCLLYLHMEQRVRCFLYLGQIFRGARFDVKVLLKFLIIISQCEVNRLSPVKSHGINNYCSCVTVSQ